MYMHTSLFLDLPFSAYNDFVSGRLLNSLWLYSIKTPELVH